MQRKPLPSADEIARLPADGGPEFNRLVFAASPYLRQHARNPVDWRPWSSEVFELARREDKPVFLSIGYSSCHWCHVMEHESFEDPEVARLLNERFIPVKVDREERPDVDEIYMRATQLMTGHGGWPNSVWLDASRRPFFCGTYFPKHDRGGHPGFLNLLHGLDEAWRTRPQDVEEQAARVAEALRSLEIPPAASTTPRAARDLLADALRALERRFDPRHGGFDGAPKFPPHSALSLLLRAAENGAPPSPMLNATLDAMALGGIHDHVGGGFHRYATDAEWFLPHFEKMLYDNAQLAILYARAFRATGRDDHRRIATGICDWVLRELRHPDGGFFSALDADTSAGEGVYYLWTREEVLRILGPDDGPAFADLFQISAAGNHHDEATGERTRFSIAHLRAFPAGDAAALAERCLPRLRDVRATREPPMLDDKVITAWNGLMISGLAHCGKLLDRPDYLEAAQRAADFLLTRLRPFGRLQRTWREGVTSGHAYLDDHAFLLLGLLDLHDATGTQNWLEAATATARDLLDLFTAPDGAFNFTPLDHELLPARTREPYDNATPSPNGVAALALLRLSALTRDTRFATAARNALVYFEPAIARGPAAAGSLVEAMLSLEHVPAEAGLLAEWSSPPVRVRVRDAGPTPHGNCGLEVEVQVESGWHLQSFRPVSPGMIATLVRLEPPPGYLAGSPTLPDDHQIPLGDGSITRGLAGTFRVGLAVRRENEGAATAIPARVYVQFQACRDEGGCSLPVQHHVDILVKPG